MSQKEKIQYLVLLNLRDGDLHADELSRSDMSFVHIRIVFTGASKALFKYCSHLTQVFKRSYIDASFYSDPSFCQPFANFYPDRVTFWPSYLPPAETFLKAIGTLLYNKAQEYYGSREH